MSCTHTKKTVNFAGETVETQYTNIFCPDCGIRLEAPGPTRPFKLKQHQR